MLEGGEDPRFIVRRMVILASEDIGNADPQALVVATAAAAAVEHVGLPEAQFALAQAAIYLSLAPKSDGAKRAIGAAREQIRERGAQPPPAYLRSSTRSDGDYDNPHRRPGHISPAGAAAGRARSVPGSTSPTTPRPRCASGSSRSAGPAAAPDTCSRPSRDPRDTVKRRERHYVGGMLSRRFLAGHGTVVAYASLFIALGGSGYAATRIATAARSAPVKVRCSASRGGRRIGCQVVRGSGTGPRGAQGLRGENGTARGSGAAHADLPTVIHGAVLSRSQTRWSASTVNPATRPVSSNGSG